MMSKTFLLVCAASLMFCEAQGGKVYGHALTKQPIEMTLYAMDESGKPLAGEPVRLYMFREDKLFAKWGGVRGVTDSNGYFRVKGTPGGVGNCGCFCDFRPGETNYYYTSVEAGAGDVSLNMVITGIVRKIVNPVKMYGDTVAASSHKNHKSELGIDMVRGELMPPDGRGCVTDAVLRVYADVPKDSVDCRGRPTKVTATVEMIGQGGGFIKAKYIPTCRYKTMREAPVEGYNPVFKQWIDLTGESIEKNGDQTKDKTYYVYKAVRDGGSNSSEKKAFYGIVCYISFDADWSEEEGLSWSFWLDPMSNGRPNDRNLEKYGWQSEEWKKANFDRIDAEPTPEALRYDRDSEGQE